MYFLANDCTPVREAEPEIPLFPGLALSAQMEMGLR